MTRQSPSRGSRGRGWKVKHVLQICVLVAVCVWLAYQVKHSQDKKKALEESNLKVSDRVEDGGANISKLGRKDPRGNVVIIDTDNSSQGEEEENKEDEEAAEHENKQEEIGEERKGTEGHETEENGEEKADEEAKHGEEAGDEESKAEPVDDAGVLEESQDHEGADGGSQEAREEQYKADDASSAVVRDTQEIAEENDVLDTEENSEEQKEIAQVEEIGNGGNTNIVTEDASKGTEEVHDNDVDGESQQDNPLPVEAATVERESGAEIESLSNSKVEAESEGHTEAYRDTTSSFAEQMEQQNNSTVSEPNGQLEQRNSSTETARDEQMGAQSVSGGVDAVTVESTTPENATMLDMASSEDQSKVQEITTLEEGSSNLENNLTDVEHNEQIEQQSNSAENVSDEQTQNISEGVSTETVESIPGNATVEASSAQDENMVIEAMTTTDDNSNTENVPTEETEKSNPTRVEGVDGSQQQTSSSTEENGDATVQGDGTSSSGDHLPNATREHEQDWRTDLSTLPEAETKTAEA